MATFLDLTTRVRREIEESETTGGVWSEASLMDWFNDAAYQVAVETKCLVDEQTANTIVGTGAYDLPDYTLTTLAARWHDTYLRRASLTEWNQRALDITATGAPTEYAVEGGNVYLYPIPNAVETLTYTRTYYPTPVTSVTATSDAPYSGRFNDLLCSIIKYRAFSQIGEWDAVRYHKSEADELMARAFAATNAESGALRGSSPTEVY
jgi:hypothetical protein